MSPRGREVIERVRAGDTLVFDGGYGTMLFAAGLFNGACPELWNDTHADVVAGHVEHRWQRWKLEGGQFEPDQPATRQWAMGALVPLLGAAVLVVAAFLLS